MLFDELDVVGSPREVVAVGGELTPATLRSAYRNGVFPWPSSDDEAPATDRALRRLVRKGVPLLPGDPEHLVPWASPHPRAVLLPDQLIVPRSLRQRLRHCGWTLTLDTAFDEVLAGCADRTSTWITRDMARAYAALHDEGGAHSVEVWDGDRLVGGLYGVLTGAVFSGESMFNRERDASKVAVVDLCGRLREAGVPVLDTQQQSPHLQALGQVLVSRADYVAAVHALRDRAVTLPDDSRAANSLAPAAVATTDSRS